MVPFLPHRSARRFGNERHDSMDKAKASSASSAQKEVDAIREKPTRSRSFIADGNVN
jgi:hypothetical protein